MSEIVIEKNIPVNRFLDRANRNRYPFAEMEPGDSFFVELDDAGINVLRVLASRFAKKHGLSFATKKMDSGVRVWRIE